MQIYTSAGTLIGDFTVKDESYRYRAIMGENALTLYIGMDSYVDIPVGSYADFQGERYTLLRPQNFVKNNSQNFEYTVILESAGALLGRFKFRDTTSGRLKFSNTAKPHEHLQMLVDNLNQRDTGWTVGEYIDNVEKVVTFNHTNCDEALKMIADAFKTEYEIVGKVISLKKLEYNNSLETALPLSYGYGNGFKSGVKRDNFDNSKAVEKLFVQGGEKNIVPSTYGAPELLLPKSQTLGYNDNNYATDAAGLYVYNEDRTPTTHIEDSLDCSHIYPSRVGTVSSVVAVDVANHFYDFIDTSIPAGLNFADCIIAGEKISVIFQTGMLAGKEFDVAYTHAAKRFAIVPQEIDGVLMPDAVFKPVAADKYAVFGVSLPTAYVCDNETATGASWDMFREAAKYLNENENPRFSFTGDLDGIWAKNNWSAVSPKLKLGGYILFTDQQFQTSGVLIRIVGIRDFINNPHSPQIEISNVTVGGGTVSSALKTIATNEVVTQGLHKDSIYFAKRRYRDAKETTEMVRAALLDKFSTSIAPITAQTMQLIVGDESLQFRFTDNNTAPAAKTPTIAFNKATKVFTVKTHSVGAHYLQHLTIGVKSISSQHSNSEYLFWEIAEFTTSSPLSDTAKRYYLYAKVSKTVATGEFLLSETPVKLEQVAGYYHLLVGVLNSETDGDRDFAQLYGFTEILPSRITTDKIVSQDGNSYFDLLNNAMKLGSFFDWNVTTANTLTLTNAKIKDSLDVDGDADLAGFVFNNSEIKSSAKVNTGTTETPVYEDAMFLDGINGIIKLIANNIDSGYASSSEKQTVTLDSSTGMIETKSGSAVSQMTSEGIFTNKGGTQAIPYSTGIELKGALVGLGFGDVAEEYTGLAALCGVYGDAENSNETPAPTFGGYFKRLKVVGEYLGLRVITSGVTLTAYDRFVSCYNSSDITVNLPANPVAGQLIEIRRNNTAQVTANGNGKNILVDTSVSSKSIGGGAGDTGRFVFDGSYWLYNHYLR